MLIYLDSSYKDYIKKVYKVVACLREAGLYLDIDKCKFAAKKVKYLGFIISIGEGIKVDPEKVAAIRSWEAPVNVKGVRSFLEFANFYREFIEDFSDLSAPLSLLIYKMEPWKWGEEQEKAFRELKERFITAPILTHWDPDLPMTLEADYSGYSIGMCLSQVDKEGQL